MVNLQKYNSSQISSLPDLAGKIIFNTDNSTVFYNSGSSYFEVLSLNSLDRVGINTFIPLSTLDINSTNGNCLRLLYNNTTGDGTTFCTQNISSTGILTFNVSGSNPSFNFTGGDIAGTLSTAAQPNITSVGTLTSLTLSGGVSGITTLSLNNLFTSTLSTASTNNTTGAVKLSGGIAISNTTDSSSSINGGTFTSAGGGAFAKSLYIGNNLYVAGDLSISGTSTVINTNTLNIGDNIIVLNSGASGTGYDSGISIERYQTDVSDGSGDIVNDTPQESYILSNATSTTITLPNGASAINDNYFNWWIKITSGSATGQVRQILSGYVGSTRTATLDSAFSITPSIGDSVNIYDKIYSSFIWQSVNKRWAVAFMPHNAPHEIMNISNYADFACENNITARLHC